MNELITETEQSHEESVLSLLQLKLECFKNLPALSIRQQDSWREWSYGELSEKAQWLTGFLNGQAIGPGSHILLLSEAQPEWAVAFFASTRFGAVLVPLDYKLTPYELTVILQNCRPSLLFFSKKMA